MLTDVLRERLAQRRGLLTTLVACGVCLASRPALLSAATDRPLGLSPALFGVALAAALHWGPPAAPGIALGAAAAALWSHASAGAALLVGAGSALGCLTAWWILRSLRRPSVRLDRVPDVVGLLVAGAAAGPAVSAAAGVAAAALDGATAAAGPGRTWLAWWTADALGALAVTPALLALPCGLLRSGGPGRRLEAAAAAAGTAWISLAIFSRIDLSPLQGEQLKYLVFPLLGWATIRFGPLGAALSVLLASAAATSQTAAGNGPFAPLEATAQSVALLLFVGVASATAQTLGAVIASRVDAEERVRRSQEQLAGILDGLQDAVISVSARDLSLLHANRAVERIFGRPIEHFRRDPALWHEVVHPDDAPVTDSALSAMLARDGGDWTYRIVRADGTHRWVLDRSRLVRDAQGQPLRIDSIVTDITDRIEAEQRLRESERFARAVIDALSSHIAVVDESGCIVAVNQAWREFARKNPPVPAHCCEGANYLAVCDRAAAHGAEDAARFAEAIRQVLSGDIDRVAIEYPCHSPTEQRWFRGTVTRFAEGGPVRAVVAHENITERIHAEQQLHQLAYHDTLTGLPNRQLLADRLESALALARRNRRHLAILFIDLDRFKEVNDSLGHRAGDELLKQVAGRLLRSVRRSDTVARLGGDEFVVLMSEVAAERDVETVAGKIRAALHHPFTIEGQEVAAGGSIGWAVFPSDGRTADQLLCRADDRLYQAKRVRNPEATPRAVVRSSPMHRVQLEVDLEQALARNELTLHYQPQVAAGSRRIVAVEALVRWQKPGRGLTLPSDFLDAADESGLIVQMGRWVLDAACAQATQWRAAGHEGLAVAVNVSVRQLAATDILAAAMESLERSGLPPEALIVEVSELAAPAELEACLPVLRDLRDAGVRLALDDFGSGPSALSHVRRFPIDVLKIDRAFLEESPGGDAPLAAAGIVQVAHALGLQVVAEGVETREEAELLAACGCDALQGYYTGRPAAAAVIGQLLATQTGIAVARAA